MAENGDFQNDRTDVHGNHAEVGNAERTAREFGDRIRGLETQSRVHGDEAHALGGAQHNEFATGEGGDKGGAARNRRDRDRAYRNALQALNDHIAMLDRQIRELERRADAIGDYLAEGDIEVGEDGRLTNEAMERELAEYERRTGQRVDRHNEEAVRAALQAQQQHILRERDGLIQERQRAQEFADRVEASGVPPSVEDMRLIIPDYTDNELDTGTEGLDAAAAAVVDEARGYDAAERGELAIMADALYGSENAPEAPSADAPEPLPLAGLEPTSGTVVADAMPAAGEVADNSGDGPVGPISLDGLGDQGAGPSVSRPDTLTVASQIDDTRLSPIDLTGLFTEMAAGEEAGESPDAAAETTLAADTTTPSVQPVV